MSYANRRKRKDLQELLLSSAGLGEQTMATYYLVFSSTKWNQRSKRKPLHQATNWNRPVCKEG